MLLNIKTVLTIVWVLLGETDMQNIDCTEMESMYLKQDSHHFCEKVISHSLYSSKNL